MTKIGVSRLPPFAFGAARCITGGLLLFAAARLLARRAGQPWLPALTSADWKTFATVGCLAVFLSNSSALWSLPHLPSNLAALLNVSSSFWIPLLGMFSARA